MRVEMDTEWPGAFYSQFLDSRMVFSAGDFTDPDRSLDEAQLAGLDGVCRQLQLRAGDRFMDLGSGWGALVVHAASEYGVHATGCTVGTEQFVHSQMSAGLSPARDRIGFHLLDCREVTGEFDKISAVGLIEHLGRRSLHRFFRQVNWILAGNGLFLSRSIVRTCDSGKPHALARHPLPTREELLRAAEGAGFRPVATSDFRLDYARTCRTWLSRLIANEAASRRIIGERMHGTWIEYLGAIALDFEDANLDAIEMLCERS